MLNDFIVKYITAHKSNDVEKLSTFYKLPFLVKGRSGTSLYIETASQLESHIYHRLNKFRDISSLDYVGIIGNRFILLNAVEKRSSEHVTHHLIAEKVGGSYFLISEN